MRTTNKSFFYVICTLIAFGLYGKFQSNPIEILIPLVVFGVVFYLYKFPPKRYSRPGSRRRTTRPAHSKSNRPKPVFRVIKGNRKDDEEEPPRYH